MKWNEEKKLHEEEQSEDKWTEIIKLLIHIISPISLKHTQKLMDWYDW
jgi:hypothetical protein